MFIIAKDKIIGLCVILIGIVIMVVYTLGSIVDLYLQSGMGGNHPNGIDLTSWLGLPDLLNWQLFVVLPLWLIVCVICLIAIWIGYSMLTTPAPVPLEELEEELAAEEAAEKKEEKK